jgi:putative ABC transport system permease protein
MIAQVALTAVGIPGAMENASQAMRKVKIRAEFPSRAYLAARIDVDRPFEGETTSAFEARWARTFAELERRIAQEPGVAAVTFADRAPGTLSRTRVAQVWFSPAAEPAYEDRLRTSAVGPGFFEAFDRPIVAGRAFHDGDRSSGARTVIVNEAFARAFSRETGSGSPIGARLRYSASARPDASGPEPSAAAEAPADRWFEIVGVVRDLGLDPDDEGNEVPFVFHAASAETVSPFVMSVRVRGNAATLAARVPFMAGQVDGRLVVRDSWPLDEWVRQRDMGLLVTIGAEVAVTALVLFLSALGIFSLVSVSVSRRTREIGLRSALGANPRRVLAGVLSRGIVLMGSGIAVGGALLLLVLAVAEQGPTGRPAEDVALFAGHFAVTSAVMLTACLLACIGPARRALRINPTEALREA